VVSHLFSWTTPPLFAVLIAGTLFLTRQSISAHPGNVFKQIINWVPLFAHLTLLLIYSVTGVGGGDLVLWTESLGSMDSVLRL
jgi:hypothetical protein